MMDKIQKSPVILSGIHCHQNPIESIFCKLAGFEWNHKWPAYVTSYISTIKYNSVCIYLFYPSSLVSNPTYFICFSVLLSAYNLSVINSLKTRRILVTRTIAVLAVAGQFKQSAYRSFCLGTAVIVTQYDLGLLSIICHFHFFVQIWTASSTGN